MKTYQVGEFKTHFAEIIEQVRAGEEVIISYGKKCCRPHSLCRLQDKKNPPRAFTREKTQYP
jgi:hypothetical protein